MIIEKGVRYGRTTKEVMKLGYPKDNTSSIKVDNEIILTDDEVREMFPNQFVILKAVEYEDLYTLLSFKKAVVKYFKCNGEQIMDFLEKLREEDPSGVYFSATNYDPLLEGDLLWF